MQQSSPRLPQPASFRENWAMTAVPATKAMSLTSIGLGSGRVWYGW